jgi:hypothetical protein
MKCFVVAGDAILRGGHSRSEGILARFELDWAFYEVLASDKFDRARPMAETTISEHELLRRFQAPPLIGSPNNRPRASEFDALQRAILPKSRHLFSIRPRKTYCELRPL